MEPFPALALTASCHAWPWALGPWAVRMAMQMGRIQWFNLKKMGLLTKNHGEEHIQRENDKDEKNESKNHDHDHDHEWVCADFNHHPMIKTNNNDNMII